MSTPITDNINPIANHDDIPEHPNTMKDTITNSQTLDTADERGYIRTVTVTDPKGQPCVVMVEGNPVIRYKDDLPPLLVETREQISKMVEEHLPANMLWLISDVIKEEAEREDTASYYKSVYSWLHENLESLIDAFVSNKLTVLAEAVRNGEAQMAPV